MLFPSHPTKGLRVVSELTGKGWEFDGAKWKKAKKPSPPEITPLPMPAPRAPDIWPSDPIIGEQVTGLDGRTWQWDGEKWVGLAWQPLEIAGPPGAQGPPGEPGPVGPRGQGLVDFSLYEQDSGQKWTDGRIIYVKSFITPGSQEGWGVIGYLNIVSLDFIVAGFQTAQQDVYQWIIPYVDSTATANGGIYLDTGTGTIVGSSTVDRSSAIYHLTYWYVCTDR